MFLSFKCILKNSELNQIWIPSSVVELKKRCFYDANNLRRVTIMPNNPFYKNYEKKRKNYIWEIR